MNFEVDMDRLITAVQLKPVLWDKTIEKYKDKFKTQDAWRDVCREICNENEFQEFDNDKKKKFAKEVLKKWTHIRDSYRKSKIKPKSGSGVTRKKSYVYASQLQFLDKVFDERETEDSYSQNDDVDNENEDSITDETVESDENLVQLVAKLPKSNFKKPTSKKRKMDPVELEMIAALREPPNPHLSFFKGLLPSLEDLDASETLDFQMEVLKIMKNIRQRKQSPCTAIKLSSPSPSTTSQFIVNRFKPNPRHTLQNNIEIKDKKLY